jgi:hypothetical protein
MQRPAMAKRAIGDEIALYSQIGSKYIEFQCFEQAPAVAAVAAATVRRRGEPDNSAFPGAPLDIRSHAP